VSSETIEAFLDRLSERSATPAGGAVAALQAAQAAGLVAMVARFSSPVPDDEVGGIIKRAESSRRRGLSLAAEDERAFGVVATALALPRVSSAERAARRRTLDAALVAAAEPPAAVVALAGELVGLAESLVPVASRSTLADLAAAVEASRAAAGISARNVAVNVAGIEPSTLPSHLGDTKGQAARTIRRADELLAVIDAPLGP
jgi:formiminotetrahydrofolate cyclodeaminase